MDSSIPPELLLPTPRTLRRRADIGSGCSTVFYSVSAILTIAATAFIIAEPMMIAFASVKDGVVTELHSTRGSKGSTSNQVVYRYQVKERAYTDSESVDASIFSQLKINQPVRVRVFDSALWHSSWLELVWQHYAAARGGVWSVAGMFDSLLLILLWSIRRQRSLLRNGTPTLGQLISKKIRRGKSTHYWLTFEFKTPPGKTIQKKTTVAWSFYDQTDPGDSLCILYDPNHPQRAVLYRAAWFECAGSKAR